MPINLDKQVKLFMLPFLYFYFLSFGMIAVFSYMLLRNPIGITPSFAQERDVFDFSNSAEKKSTDEINIKLSPKKVEPTVTPTIESNGIVAEPILCNKDVAGKIDAYFGKINAPLAGHGCDFDIHGQISKVKPEVVAAIAMCESTGGKVTPQFQGTESYNAFGWAVFDSNDVTKDVDGYKCDSWEHCIGRVTRGIARNSEKRNLTTAPEDIVKWYNPGSVKRAEGIAENSSWFQCVDKVIAKIQSTTPTEDTVENLATVR